MSQTTTGGIGAGKTVVICGAGLAGALLACYLAKLGYTVRLHERRGDPRRAGYAGGRSINLALSARGLWALDGIGLKQRVLDHAIPMRGRIMHKAVESPELVFQPYSKDPADAINSISRSGLNIALLDAAEQHPGVTILFNQRCVDVDLARCAATFVDDSNSGSAPGSSPVTDTGDLIVGADGAFSAVRGAMVRTDRYDYSQSYLDAGYKELHIPPRADGSYALDPSALHIWPRGSAMMIALPNPDKSFTCTLFWPYTGEHSFAAIRGEGDVLPFFKRHYPDAVPLMPTLVEDYRRNPVGSLVTVKCWPWTRFADDGRAVTLLGDACHAIVPFYGQGMNAAFEDVRVLAECLERHGGDLRPALEQYQALRKPNADAIARMAIENFVEMRDKVGTRGFLWRKRVEHFLHDLFPRSLVPRYNLVSFSTVPYVEALRAGITFDRIILALLLLPALPVMIGLWAVGVPAWLFVIAAGAAGAYFWARRTAEPDAGA
jgi:kynurenine 3-monooxygenase